VTRDSVTYSWCFLQGSLQLPLPVAFTQGEWVFLRFLQLTGQKRDNCTHYSDAKSKCRHKGKAIVRTRAQNSEHAFLTAKKSGQDREGIPLWASHQPQRRPGSTHQLLKTHVLPECLVLHLRAMQTAAIHNTIKIKTRCGHSYH
jgi:hypothetical protein